MSVEDRQAIDPGGEFHDITTGEYFCLECGLIVVDQSELLCEECSSIYFAELHELMV